MTRVMRRAPQEEQELRRSVLAALLAKIYALVPGNRLLASIISRLEGGHMSSGTLRAILREHHGVEVGAHTYGSLLVPGRADTSTTIGRYVSIGPDVRRLGAAHPMDHASLHPYWYHREIGLLGHTQDVDRSPISIGDDCWIGAGVIILPGCRRIGTGAVIGAGAVVTHDVDDFAIVVGVPGREVGTRLNAEKRQRLLELHPWRYPPTECRRILDQIEKAPD